MGSADEAPPAPVCVLRGHSEVQAVCFHPDLPLLYAGDAAGVLSVWDCTDRRVVERQQCACYHATLLLWTLSSGRLMRRLYDRASGVLSLAACGHHALLSQGREGRLALWPLTAEGRLGSAPLAVLLTLQYSFCRAGVHQQESEQLTLAAVGQDAAAVSLYRLRPRPVSGTPQKPEQTAQELALLGTLQQPAGEAAHGMCMCLQLLEWQDTPLLLAAGHEGGHLAIWDCAARACLASSRLFKEPATALAASASGPEILVSSASTAMALVHYDAAGRTLKLVKRLALSQAGCDQVALRGDGRLAAAACWSGLVEVFHARTGKALATLQYHTAAVTSVAFHPATQLLASGSRDGSIACWSLYRP